MKNKFLNPTSVLILGLCTFGIANSLFIYAFSKFMRFDKNGYVIYPMKELILNIITFGIYGIYWTFSINSALNIYEEQGSCRGLTVPLTVISALPIIRAIALAVTYSRIQKASRHISYIN